MYVRKVTRRRLNVASLVFLLVVVLTPKFEIDSVPQFAALLTAVGWNMSEVG